MAQNAVTFIGKQLDPTKWDLNKPVPQSLFVSFFHNWPRYGRSNDIAFSGRYMLTCFLVALPWVIVALLCFVFATIVNICYGGVRRRGRKPHLGDEDSESSTANEEDDDDSDISAPTYARLAGGVLLFNSAMFLLGLALVANYVFYGGANTILNLTQNTAIQVSNDIVRVISVAKKVLNAISNRSVFDLDKIRPTIALRDINSTLTKAADQFEKTSVNVERLEFYVRQFAISAFWLSVGVYFIIFFGFMLLFSTAFPKRRYQRIAMALYVVPFVLGWISVAIVTATSTVAADLCAAMGDFQRIVLEQSGIALNIANGIDISANIFLNYNIQCPANIVGTNFPFNAVVDFIGNVLNGPFALQLLGLVYPRASSSDLRQLNSWLVPTISNAADCSLITTLAAQFNYVFCHYRGPMMALFIAWVSLIILAVLLTIAYFLTQFTHFEASRFITPYIKLDADLYEAFTGVYGTERISKDVSVRLSDTSAQKSMPPVQVEPVFRMPGEASPPSQPPQREPIATRAVNAPLSQEGITDAAVVAAAAAPAVQQKRKKKKLFGRKNAASNATELVSQPENTRNDLPQPLPVITSKASRAAPPPPLVSKSAPSPPPPPVVKPISGAAGRAPPPPPPVVKPTSGTAGRAPPPPPPPPPVPPSARSHITGRGNRAGIPPPPPPVVSSKRSSAPPPPPPVMSAKRSGASPPPPPPPMPALKRPAPSSSSAPPPPPPPPARR